MLPAFRHFPIQRKVRLVILFASLTSLLLASSSLAIFQWISTRQTIKRDLLAQAEILAANSTAALRFADVAAAAETLATLKAKSSIVSAALYQTNGQRFAGYGEPEIQPAQLPPGLPDGFQRDTQKLTLIQPVTLDGRRLGSLYLRFDFAALQWNMLAPFLSILSGIVLAMLLLTMALSALLQRVITVPVLRLAATVKTVTEQKDYSVRAEARSRDELGQLTLGFNQMLGRIQADDMALRQANEALAREVAERQQAQARLEELQRQLMESSRQAGMAEIATGVLHNVGNVLNSVNVSATLISDRVASTAASRLTAITDLFRQHAADLPAFFAPDSAGQKMPPYLEALQAVLAEEREQLLQETALLCSNVNHIKEIVAMQQTYAGASGCFERLAAADLIEDSLKLHLNALTRHGVRVERDYADVPLALLDRHKVFQILLNLISNANKAIKEGHPADPCLILRTRSLPEERLQIEVADNGVGIPTEQLTRVFAQGFTTWTDGHGFGLHTSVLHAKEMGGSLTAHSRGVGQGATFTLELPLNHSTSS
jgi:two-component system, NtrC family, sensor kinase